MPPKPSKLRLFHITPWQNLPNILASKGLWCPHELERRSIQPISIAYGHIQGRRAKKIIHLPPGGTLHDYVPFNFAPHSPMLCAIAHNRLEQTSVQQEAVVHLVTDLAQVQRAGVKWVFTDGHAAIAFTKFFDRLTDLYQIDWEIMRDKMWTNTDDDGDRTRRRQAEFLVHSFVPWELIVGIGVMTEETGEQVRDLLSHTANPPAIQVMPNWYF